MSIIPFMATARRLLVDPAVSGVYHCVSRCVRRAFLCGKDPYSGQNFEHRRGWIQERLRLLVEVFAVEVYAYAVMSNHLHLTVRTLPGRIVGWDDEEVARRWLRIFPGKRIGMGLPQEHERAVRALCLDRARLAECRIRLSDLSWFMRCLNEPIARRANSEDRCTGRFWEGRFKCQKLDDAGAALACMAYVDLNPVRAGMAATPEESRFTSARDRARACQARRQLARAPQQPSPEQARLIAQAGTNARCDDWLADIGPNSQTESCDHCEGALPDPPPLLGNLEVEHYLELLDWTGRQIRSDKRGHIPCDLRPILERLDLKVDAWVDNVELYGGLFRRFAGTLRRLGESAQAIGCSWFQGQHGARRLYASSG